MREAVTAGAAPTDVPSGRAMRPAHAYWRARTLRTQLLSLFILIELIAAAVAGAVSIFNARSATRVEIAASMELAELWVKEGFCWPSARRRLIASWLTCHRSFAALAMCVSR